ncbi:MAG: MBOAT family protein [Ruminococcaceae bacterium]|nr:MBOAT family protein [Oscillospiraceae bacterium]
MSLSSSFILFLAVLLPLYFLLPHRYRWFVLLAASLAFYSFAGLQNFLVLLTLAALTYTVGRLLGHSLDKQNTTLDAHRADGSWDKPARRAYRDRCTARRRWLLAVGIAGDLALLAAFKYSGLVLHTWQVLTGTEVHLPSLLLPLGLSYVTLSAIGYLVDVFRGQIECEKDPLRFALFTFYFPQMWQGPINRYSELAPQLTTPHPFDAERVLRGALRALWGTTKKIVIANTVGVAVGAIMQKPTAFGGTGVLLLIVLYSIQIYGDFTGGMDICLGISSALGIDLYENFDHPFGACSVADYWRRWHRSMGRFFTDYVFYPLSTCRLSQKLSRLSRRLPLWMATLVTWTLTGLWHGAGWNFVVWGLCNGLFMLLSQTLRPVRRRLSERFPCVANGRALAVLCCGGTLFTVGLFRTLDVYQNVGMTFSLWARMLVPDTWRGLLDRSLWTSLGLNLPQWILIFLGVLAMWAVGRATPRVDDKTVNPISRYLLRHPLLYATVWALLVVVIAVLGHYGLGYDAMDFIYGQF